MASSSAYLTRYCIAVANTTIQTELSLNDVQMGLILSAFGWGYLICQVPGGWLGNRIGTRSSLPLLSILWSVFTVWTGLAGSYLNMFASRVSFGLAQAGLVPNSAKVLKDWIPVHRLGIASALIGASMSIGGALTMYMTGVLIKHMYWRHIFFAYSSVGVIWAIVFYWFFRTKPEQHPRINAAELSLIRDEEIKQKSDKPKDEDQHDDRSLADLIFSMLPSLTMWAICVQSFFRAAGYLLFVSWFPAFLEYAYGIGPDQSGTYTMWPLLGVVVGATSGGFIVDSLMKRTESRFVSRCGVSIGALTCCALITLSSALTTTVDQLVVVMAIGALCSGVGSPAAWAATIDIGGKHTAVVVGIMNMAGCISGVVVPPLLGMLIQHIKQTDGDWNLVIYLHVGFYLAGAISWLFVNPNVLVTERHASIETGKDFD